MSGAKSVRLDGPVAQILGKHQLPKMYRVQQHFDASQIVDLKAEFEAAAAREGCFENIKPGMRVAVAAGSRGIDKYAQVVRLAVDKVKEYGGSPFVFPAMGSHGGATGEGQLSILTHYGITEESMGCPILSSMETVYVADTPEGIPVYMDKNAYHADGIIIINRVKAHTAIRNRIESGMVKMSAIGLGKQKGADYCHARGYDALAHNVEELAKVNIASGKILFGIGLIENGYDKLKKLAVVPADRFFDEEPELLIEAMQSMPKLYIDKCDILVVDRVGKNISGSGMDPNISGTHHSLGTKFGGIESQRLVVLDLTDETEGNGTGIGYADFVSQRVFDKFDFNMSYANPLTAVNPWGVRIPMVLPNDKMVLQGAVQVCTGVDRSRLKIVRIKDTLDISTIEISEALLDVIKSMPDRFDMIEGPFDWDFDENGNLL